MRSLLRWLRRIVTGVVLLVAVVIAVALVTAHTGWGREQLRARVEAVLQAKFPGGARIGAIEGSLLGTLTMRDLELDGRDHTPLVTIGTLDVAVALWPLLAGTAHVDNLVAGDVHVFVHRDPEGRSPVAPASGPSPWRVELPHVGIHHARIEITAGASTQTIADVDVFAAATVDATGVVLFGGAHGHWQERAAELTATASVVLDGGVHVPGALVTLGAVAGAPPRAEDGDPAGRALAVLGVTRLAIDVDHPSGTLAMSAPARVLATLVPELARAGIAADRLGDVVATVGVVSEAPAMTRVEVTAKAGDTTASAELHGDLAAGTARGEIRAHAIDLGLVTRGQAGGRGELVVTGAGHRTDGADGADGAVVLDLAQIVATSRAIDVRDQRVTGALAIDAKATGTLAPALAVDLRGTLAGDQLAVNDVARTAAGRRAAVKGLEIAAVTGSFQLHVATGAPLGEAHLTATGLRNAGTPLGAAHADLENHADGTLRVAATAWPPANGLEISAAALVIPGPRIVARLDHTRVTLPNGMIWAGHGGVATVTDAKIELRDLTLHGGDATIALRGDLARPTGTLVVHAGADGFQASAIDPRVRGLVRGTLDLTHGSSWQGDATFTVAGFAVAADAAPVDGTAHVGIAGRRATLDAAATSPALGRVELALEADAPRDPLDVAAWQALDRGAVRNATITARQVQLSGLTALAPPRPPTGAPAAAESSAPVGSPAPRVPLAGTIDGTVNLAPAALHGGFAVRGVSLPAGTIDGDVTLAPRLPFAMLDGAVTFTPREGDPGASSSAPPPGRATAKVSARFALPERPFDPATWQRRGRDLVQEATAQLDEVALGPEVLAGYGIAAPLRGHATATLAIGAELRDARLAIDVNDLRGGPLVTPLSAHLAIRAGDGGTHVHAALAGPGSDPLGTLEADVPMTPDRWITEPASVLRAPITAHWTLPVTPIKAVLAIVGRQDLDGGTLEGGATIHGTLGTPIVTSARLLARDIAVPPRLGGHPPPALRELEAVATWGGASGTLEITGREASGGELHVHASGRPDALSDVTGWLRATRFDLAPIGVLPPRALVPTAGVVTADLTRRSDGQVTGTLGLTGGALPIAAPVGTLRDVTATVELAGSRLRGTLDGKLGAGTVHLSAEAASDLATIELHELRLANVSTLGGLRPIITATLATAEGKPLQRRDGVLRGDVTVRHATITLPEHPGTPLLDARAPADLVLAGAPEAAAVPGPRAPAHPWLEVHVALDRVKLAARNVVNSVGLSARATLRGEDLTVSVGETVGLRGNVTIDDADVDFLGRRYVLDPSQVDFDGTIDPELHITMTHQFPELRLSVGLGGRASHPEKPTFASEPTGYSQDQLFGFFVGGEPGGDPSSQTGEAVKGAVAQSVSGMLGRQVNKVLPIKVDTLSCEPGTTATGPSCTVGKWLSQRLFLAYRQHLAALPGEDTNDLQFQYRLGPKVLIEGTGGDRGHAGADLLWRHRW
jgi:TamB, inner membrane protein subunit of TAM complex